jgi:hypothetical protein
MRDTGAVHVVIPDTQAKPGVPTDHLAWIGHYIVDQFAGRPGVEIIHLGDHWDMASLSSYDKGKKAMEGRRYVEDVTAGNEAFAILNAPLNAYNATRAAYHEARWRPGLHLLRGNHEDRITRATENDAQLDGLLSLDQLESPGWQVYDFLEPLWLDGVGYAHFWANPMTGRPHGGQAATRLKTIGHSFTMGHQQTLDYALRFVGGRSQHALICGACYLHDEDYKGPQGNAHWRGIVVCHQVEAGSYDPMMVSLDYLCRRYEGVRLAEFMADRYPDLTYG